MSWAGPTRPGRIPTGVLVVLKPATDGSEPLDVGEYGRERPAFPQQTTLDQFFDEAQFESYRQLGMLIAESAFPPGADDGKTAREVFGRILGIGGVQTTTGDGAIHGTLSRARRNVERVRDMLL